jgi:hypothetical protein
MDKEEGQEEKVEDEDEEEKKQLEQPRKPLLHD